MSIKRKLLKGLLAVILAVSASWWFSDTSSYEALLMMLGALYAVLSS
ncbi:MAG: hypothetical protein SF162_06115 [bacterium]|nr:hypothetical protein [bacterium]